MLIGLLVIAAIAALIAVSVSTGFFGLMDSRDADLEYVDDAVDVGFEMERNIVERRVRVLIGEFEGARTVVVIPRNNESLTTGHIEVRAAAALLLVGTNWQGFTAGRAQVLCDRDAECDRLAIALGDAIAGS